VRIGVFVLGGVALLVTEGGKGDELVDAPGRWLVAEGRMSSPTRS
jgi:hypothetical protein